MVRNLVGIALVTIACACSPPPVAPSAPADATPQVDEAIPTGRLPEDVRPVHYDLELQIVPAEQDFRGRVGIDVQLDRARSVIWLHGNGLRVETSSITPEGGAAIEANYQQVDPGGVARLDLAQPVGPGRARIEISYAASFSKRLDGLYRVETGGHAYAFTQMEPVWTRKAFPCFNEPAFKTPWDVQLVVADDDEVVANTRELSRQKDGPGLTRVTFATSEPMPSYLVAFAVGPLDVVTAPDIPANDVRSRPLPFRGIAAKGRGSELKYALEHTPAILEVLEDYFGTGYPYDKLDIIAVPDKGGAMENVGAITFREWLLLLDGERAPINQQRAFAYVMAHELAHMWFGNLVTMPWWDDIWLNEAFATWMGYRAVHKWRPTHQADVRMLEAVHGAMGSDSLVNARQIRQPVTNNDDIHNAFDRITYRKGGGVLSMVERWMGADAFRSGLRAYMRKHRHGSATADDLLAALSTAAGKDIATPFRTFLFQPGLPNIDVKLSCKGDAALQLAQSRHLPLGSTGDRDTQTWQVPVCVRYQTGAEVHEQCTLLKDKQATVKLQHPGCPSWLMPNADGAGYYVWSLSDTQLATLVNTGLAKLSTREKMSVAKSVRSSFSRGDIDYGQALAALEPLANDPHPAVATAPMRLFRTAQHWLGDDPLVTKLQARSRKLYAPHVAQLGWKRGKDESPETTLLRKSVLNFQAFVSRDAGVRERGRQLARKYLGLDSDNKIHREAIDPNLAGVALAVSGEEADSAHFDALLFHLDRAADEVVRGNTLIALSNARAPELASRARELMLHDVLKVNEAVTPLYVQLGDEVTRADTWQWLEQNIDALIARLPERRAGWLPSAATVFCSEADAQAAQKLFAPRLAKLAGGPRELAKALERIRICAAQKKTHLAGVKKVF